MDRRLSRIAVRGAKGVSLSASRLALADSVSFNSFESRHEFERVAQPVQAFSAGLHPLFNEGGDPGL